MLRTSSDSVAGRFVRVFAGGLGRGSFLSHTRVIPDFAFEQQPEINAFPRFAREKSYYAAKRTPGCIKKKE